LKGKILKIYITIVKPSNDIKAVIILIDDNNINIKNNENPIKNENSIVSLLYFFSKKSFETINNIIVELNTNIFKEVVQKSTTSVLLKINL